MTLRLPLTQTTDESLKAAQFFQESDGKWRSERRYYTLPHGETVEGLTFISNRFLEQGSPELLHLAKLHELPEEMILTCGIHVTWESVEPESGRQRSVGETLFGVRGDVLYRDRGFAVLKPITAEYYFSAPKTLHLRTEYKGSVFEEEIKLIGRHYRTRQSIISRAGEQQMIGQYLEKRVEQELGNKD